jgi:hypothetical protein
MPTTAKKIFAPSRALNAATNISPNAYVAPQRAPVAVTPCCCPACTSLQCLDRTRFFAGQLLTEADLNNEQSYWLAKGRLHNRFLHGWGVVCGLQVVCGDCDGWVTVKTGYALDPCGNDIIVCQEQPFNVLQAIQACCAPPKQGNCAPLRATPPPTCQDLTQTWCLTIQYQEQETRLVTSLQAPSQSGSCGCGGGSNGGSKGGCGCGCRGGSGASGHSHGNSNGSSTSSCGCSSTQSTMASTVPAGACEPTRIIEGFKLGVMCQPETPATFTTNQKTPAPQPGTYTYQFEMCLQTLQALIAQKPVLDPAATPAQVYQAACNYLRSVKNYFASSYFTQCQIESTLNQIAIPAPPAQDPNYVNTVQGIVDGIAAIVAGAAIDCFCTSFLPTCPPDPCDNRLILACVTVQNGKIIDICHFGGRKQVVTFPTLYYWLSIFKFDVVLADIVKFLQAFCCSDTQVRQGLFGAATYEPENITSAGFTNPAALNKTLASFAADKFGAVLMNAVSPNTPSVDLRPLIGMNTETALQALLQYNIPRQNIVQTSVDSDPSWTDDAVASSALYAPASFNATENLTVYTKGKQVVGLAATSPTDVLRAQVEQLQQRVDQLTGQMAAKPQSAAAKQEHPAKHEQADEAAKHPKKKH